MRTLTLAFVCALFAGCAWGEGSPSGGDDDQTTPDASTSGAAVCGDAVCAASEVGSCNADCGGTVGPVCGNNVCETGETTASCASDCTTAGPVCGDGTCDMAGGENASNCAGDCGTTSGTCPADPNECLLCVLDPTLCPSGHDETSCTACLFPM
jgi:hypothetical protein